MKTYKCRKCEYIFCSENGMPYCPACECENLILFEDDYIYENKDDAETLIENEEHHIHPRFMDNTDGYGQKYILTRKKHIILHGMIMKWLWENIRKEDKKRVIDDIIYRSKEFIGVKDDSRTA